MKVCECTASNNTHPTKTKVRTLKGENRLVVEIYYQSFFFVLIPHKSILRHFNVTSDKLSHFIDKVAHKRNLSGR